MHPIAPAAPRPWWATLGGGSGCPGRPDQKNHLTQPERYTRARARNLYDYMTTSSGRAMPRAACEQLVNIGCSLHSSWRPGRDARARTRARDLYYRAGSDAIANQLACVSCISPWASMHPIAPAAPRPWWATLGGGVGLPGRPDQKNHLTQPERYTRARARNLYDYMTTSSGRAMPRAACEHSCEHWLQPERNACRSLHIA